MKVRLTRHTVEETVCYIRVPTLASAEEIDATLRACRHGDLLWSGTGLVQEGPTRYELVPPDLVPKNAIFLEPPLETTQVRLLRLLEGLIRVMERRGIDTAATLEQETQESHRNE
jgi:hypothetical protein